MDSRTNNSMNGIFYGLFAKLIMMFFPFAIRTIIVRKMGIDYAGLNTLFSSILSFLSLTELGVGSTLVYSMYKPVAEDDNPKICALLKLYKKCYLIIGGIMLVVGMILLPFLPRLVSGNVPIGINLYCLYLIYLLNISLSYFLVGYKSSLFVAFQKTDIQSKVMLFSYAIMGFLQIISILVLKNYYGYVACNIIFTLIQNLLIYVLSKKYFPTIRCEGKLKKSEVIDIFKKTGALASQKIGGTIVGSLDSIVISAILGLNAVGKYGNYYTILAALMALIGVYNNAILPSIGNYIVKESKDKANVLFINLNFIHIWIVGWITLCLSGLLQDFISIWVGNSNLLSISDSMLFCLYFYSWQFRVLLCNFKDAAGLWTQDVLKPYIASIVNILLNIYLVNKIGISGALISTIVCMFFIFFPWEIRVLYKDLFEMEMKTFILKEMKWGLIWLAIIVLFQAIFRLIDLRVNFLFTRLIAKILICILIPNALFGYLNKNTSEFEYFKEKILIFKSRLL